jgi:hypothetical protein
MASMTKLSQATIEEVAKVLGKTTEGFTGPEIARLLADCGIENVRLGATKRKRIVAALQAC